jgi:hypothetical protein
VQFVARAAKQAADRFAGTAINGVPGIAPPSSTVRPATESRTSMLRIAMPITWQSFGVTAAAS